MKKEVSYTRGPYNINHIDDKQRKEYLKKLNSQEYLNGAIDRLASKISMELVRQREINEVM